MSEADAPGTGVGAEAVRRLLHPRSVAVVGASDDPASIGGAPIALLERFGFAGEVHLVSRSRARVGDRRCVAAIDDLPAGIDAAILAIPRAGVEDALDAAARRGIGGVVVFSSGYGELGAEGAASERALGERARRHGIALAGPNCLGLINFNLQIPLTFADARPNRRASGAGVAIVAQSGAMSMALTYAAMAQDTPVTYTISTGNEAVLGIEDYLPVVLDDERTRAVVLLVEQIRRPDAFRAVARDAAERGCVLLMLHTGRSERAKAASLTHTGALAGDQSVIRSLLRHENVLVIDSLDELIDTAQLIVKRGRPSTAAVAFMTDSGAAKTHALDIGDAIGLAFADLAADTEERLAAQLPAFATAENPTDITAMGLNDPSLYGRVAETLIGEDAVGTLVVAAMPGSETQGTEQVDALLPVLAAAHKPVAYTIMGGDWPLIPGNVTRILDAGVPFFRSPERALRAVKNATLLAAPGRRPAPGVRPITLALDAERVYGEVEAKAVLAELGVPVPAGGVVCDVGAAQELAETLGYPVVLKVVSTDLLHKSDVGGVVGVEHAGALAERYRGLLARVRAGAPAASIAGVLVERAERDGVEVLVGARRDPTWGPVLVLGLGGIFANTLNDSVVISPEADRAEMRSALAQLRGFPLLQGARGARPCDLDALCDVAALLAGALRGTAQLCEIEVNPLLVRARGEGVVALDALIACAVP